MVTKKILKKVLEFLPIKVTKRPTIPREFTSKRPVVVGKLVGEKISEEIVNEIFSFYDSVPPFYEGMSVRKELEIGGAWKQDLLENRKNQIKFIQNRDLEKFQDLLENMFFNELKQGIWNYRYWDNGRVLTENLPYQFIDECKIYEKITSSSVEWLASSRFFDSWGAQTKSGAVKYPSVNHGIQAFNIKNLIENFSKPKGELINVLDLGSGWGGMTEYLLRYRNTIQNKFSITLMDIPLNLTTAYAYLSKIFSKDDVILVKCKSELNSLNFNELKVFLVPSCFIESLDKRLDIVNNYQSFSEMDLMTVNFYVKNLTKHRPKFIIENNSNLPNSSNYGGFKETLVRDIVLPKEYSLLARFSASESWSRYVTSIYTCPLKH